MSLSVQDVKQLKPMVKSDVRKKISLNEAQLADVFERIKEYAESRPYFTGGDILYGLRADKLSLVEGNMTPYWAKLIADGERKQYYRAFHRVFPSTPQSHTPTVVLWKSLLYKGEFPPMPNTSEQIESLYRMCVTRQLSLRDALGIAIEWGRSLQLTAQEGNGGES